MSILIKGMEMPENGRLTLQISADGAVYVVNSCNITAETYTTDAVPVPPHGRLIDADALREGWLENGENEYVYDTNAFLDSLDDSPTIIPASGGAEDE